jgi:hypothetical protein
MARLTDTDINYSSNSNPVYQPAFGTSPSQTGHPLEYHPDGSAPQNIRMPCDLRRTRHGGKFTSSHVNYLPPFTTISYPLIPLPLLAALN